MRGGVRLALHERGQGRPVVFQHGLCGDARQTLQAFPDQGLLMTLECRGHGQSDATGPYSIAVFADDVAALIETLDGPVILGGISMGAAIATRLAVIRPDLVRALISRNGDQALHNIAASWPARRNDRSTNGAVTRPVALMIRTSPDISA